MRELKYKTLKSPKKKQVNYYHSIMTQKMTSSVTFFQNVMYSVLISLFKSQTNDFRLFLITQSVNIMVHKHNGATFPILN